MVDVGWGGIGRARWGVLNRHADFMHAQDTGLLFLFMVLYHICYLVPSLDTLVSSAHPFLVCSLSAPAPELR